MILIIEIIDFHTGLFKFCLRNKQKNIYRANKIEITILISASKITFLISEQNLI